MHLTHTNYKEVESDCQNVPATRFNTCFHTIEEIPAQIRAEHLKCPSEEPCSFRRWLPLILEARNLDLNAVQIVKFTPAQAKLIIAASATSIITGEHNRAYEEDINEEIIPHLSSLKFPAEGLFMRLDHGSPKDGRQTVPGRLSLHSPNDIILRLTTSQRAQNEMRKILEEGSPTIDLNFLPFNKRMGSKREYRVYCAPAAGAITAGLSFDVFYDETDESSQLVELNVFDARSGCGSCLFHWINDWEKLYGDGERVEFRVTRQTDGET
ncbi:hypothetical protein FBEOM_3342 [Fusarium beomiforme]|uniref:Uncharacterized protein n=1 Tax=Fusarium beomiforme TaxID=44412 RepID=A0A9P5ARU7_9HYPO|nr:hypothetical protein FBEOM_3342 [Fusarium beomiforme]